MKSVSLRLIAFFLVTLSFGLSGVNATAPVRIDCSLCKQEYTTTRWDCPRCRFVNIGLGPLSEPERQHLTRFVSSDEYQATLSRSEWEWLAAISAQIVRPPRQMADIYLTVAYLAERAPAEDYLRAANRFLPLALASLQRYLASLPANGSDQKESLTVVELLRRLGRFDDARLQLQSIDTKETRLSPEFATALDRESDLIEIKSRNPHYERIAPPPVGNVSGIVIPATESIFSLTLFQPRRIAEEPKVKYPLEMRYAMIPGEAKVAVAVDEKGAVSQAKAVRASLPDFIADAEKFARGCRFAPRIVDGKAEKFECVIAVVFELKYD